MKSKPYLLINLAFISRCLNITLLFLSFFGLAQISRIAAQTSVDHSVPQATTEMSMSSDAGDYIGGGQNYYYAPGVGTYNPSASDGNGDNVVDTVSFNFNGQGSNWSITFSTRLTGGGIIPGFYNNAVRYPFESNTSPGLSIYGNGRGCNQLTGNFTVHDADFDTSTSPTRVNRFTATFEQHCEGGTTAFYGTVYYNYTPAGPAFSASGQLIDNFGSPLSNRPVSLYGSQTSSAVTDDNGNYQFSGLLPSGNFRVVPTDANLVFSPSNRLLRRILNDQTSVDFTGVPLYSIGGQVLNNSGMAVTGVTVQLSGSQTRSVTTDSEGRYIFSNLLADGTYTVTPSRTFYSFTPSSHTFTTLPGNQTLDFVGRLAQYSISGRILNNAGTGISGVRVDLSGGLNRSVVSDGNGIYSFEGVDAGNSYQVRPISAAYVFSPSSQSFFALDRDYSQILFTAGSPTTYSISGFILDAYGNGVSNANVQLSGNAAMARSTDASGFYTFTGLLAGNSFTVIPQKAGLSFRPQSRSVISLNQNMFLNFVGNNQATRFDFDGDHKTDLSIFRVSLGQWWYQNSSDGANRTFVFGSNGDKIVPADYTGDGKTDIATFSPSTGLWNVLRSEDSTFNAFQFGMNGDLPAPADYDGDGKADSAVFRPSNSTWYINGSTVGITTTVFGMSGDVPVVADYDGDGKADLAIYRTSLGQWWHLRSSDGSNRAVVFGTSADKPVQGDYTGDGKADQAFYRPVTGEWFILRSEDNSFYSFPFGADGDIPVAGDYDGDGKFDSAVFRQSGGTWYLNRSTAGVSIQSFGIAGDLPVPSAFMQ